MASKYPYIAVAAAASIAIAALAIAYPPNNEVSSKGDVEHEAPAPALPIQRNGSEGPGHNAAASQIPLGRKVFRIEMTQPDFNGDAVDFIDAQLSNSKAGDGHASYQIHSRVSSCKQALDPGDDEEYRAYASIGLGEGFSRRVEREIENCRGLTARKDILDVNWLALAAAQGSIEGRLVYAQNPRAAIGTLGDVLSDPEKLVEYRQNAVRYLEDSASRGNVDSIEALANIHARGIIAGRSTEKSLAYWMALHRANPTEYSAESVSRLSTGMDAEQFARSQNLSDAIYRSCCE
ncbi:hypothetical protein [uncultured Stenotrophomonas sp.]|uniref:hypothetical protein n=1 Tax=uncultured Stenotrophomonas sp. TaxID=165438 RepID=UPI0025DAC370|nr:hypothetical protein [uncultured Stenotrophomonas sp.]